MLGHLEDADYLLRNLMDNIPDNIYFKDTDSRFIMVNRAFGDWAGIPDTMPVGHEAIGTVEALGPGAERFIAVGDRVILGLGGSGGGYWCGACEYCLGGEPRHPRALVDRPDRDHVGNQQQRGTRRGGIVHQQNDHADDKGRSPGVHMIE